jgi:hypothetical protein
MIDPRYNFIIGFNFLVRLVLSTRIATYAVHLSSDLSPSSHFIEKRSLHPEASIHQFFQIWAVYSHTQVVLL